MTNAPAPGAPTLSTLLRLAWPIVVSRSTQVVIGISDALMVASLGKAALAATTTGGFNTYALLIFPMGVCFIVSSFASQLFGRGDVVGARRYGWYGLAVAAATQVIAMAAIPFAGGVLGLLEYEPAVHDAMTRYLMVRLTCGGAAIGLEALANYYGGIGNTVLPMRANVLAMVLNVALNWVFIGGHLGAPALGVTGAALASSLATWIAFLAFLAVFLRDGVRDGVIVPPLRWAELTRMLKFGLPSGMNWFFEFFAFNVFVNVAVAGLGTASLAAFMSVIQINSAAFMPAFGLASAGAILVGQSIGAGRRNEVPGTLKLSLLVTSAWQCTVGLIYLAMPGVIFAPFAEGDAELLAIGIRMLMLSTAWQLFDAAAITTAEALRAAGDTSFTMWARTILAWALFVPGSWITVRIMGGGDVVAVLWVVGYLAVLAAVLLLRFRTGAWRRIELVEEPLVDPVMAPSAPH